MTIPPDPSDPVRSAKRQRRLAIGLAVAGVLLLVLTCVVGERLESLGDQAEIEAERGTPGYEFGREPYMWQALYYLSCPCLLGVVLLIAAAIAAIRAIMYSKPRSARG